MCVFVTELEGSPLAGEMRTLDGWCIKMVAVARKGGTPRSEAITRMLTAIDEIIGKGGNPHAVWTYYIQPKDVYGLRRDAEIAGVEISQNDQPEYGWRRYRAALG